MPHVATLSGCVATLSGCVATLSVSLGVLRHGFLLSNLFSSPICRGHNFLVLTQICACEVSLESSLNVESNYGWS